MLQRWRLCFFVFVVLAALSSCEEDSDEHNTKEHFDEEHNTKEHFDEEHNAKEHNDMDSYGDVEGEEAYGNIPVDVLEKIHSKMDADKDGNVSHSELMAFGATMRTLEAKSENMSSLVESLDTDKDGKLSFQEVVTDLHTPEEVSKMTPVERKNEEAYRETYVAKFKAADRNADSALEADEVRFFFFPELHDEVITMVATATLKAKDKDGDNKLTPEEFLGKDDVEKDEDENDLEHFKFADRDKDGTLSLNELKSFEAGSHVDESIMSEFFEHADEDNDQLVTAHEMVAEYEKDVHADHVHHFHRIRSHLEL